MVFIFMSIIGIVLIIWMATTKELENPEKKSE